MDILTDSTHSGNLANLSVFERYSRQILAKAGHYTRELLALGQRLRREHDKLQLQHGVRQGSRLFKEQISSLGWAAKQVNQAIFLAERYFALPSKIRRQLRSLSQFWHLEALTKLLKLSVEQIQQVLAQAGQEIWNSTIEFLRQFAPKKHLKPGELITEENWPAIAELMTQKLGLDEGQIEKIQLTSQAIAQGEDLNTDHLVIALSRRDYDIDKLFPPPKAKAYKPEEIERIKTEAKAQALTEAREQVMAEIQPRLKALEDERQSDRTLIEQLQEQLQQKQLESESRIQQLEQQLQTLIQRSPTQQADSTVGAQAIATLLKTGESHPAVTVPPFTSKREFPGAQHGSPQKSKTSKKTPSPGKGFGQSVNQKHRR